MGYRLNIDKIVEDKNYDLKIKNIYYGTKLYSYKDNDYFLSYMYLVSIGKLERDEFFGYSSNQRFSLNKKEFTIFCYLYNIDYNNNKYLDEQKDDIFINDINIQKELMDDINEYDNYIYIISWN